MSNVVKVNAHYRLPKAIELSSDCLNEVVPIRLLGYNAVLRLPDVNWNSDNKPMITAPSISESSLAMLHHFNSGSLHNLWGSVSTWNPTAKSFRSFALTGLLLELDLDASKITYSNYLYGRGHPKSDEITKLGQDIDAWFDELCLWVAVVTKQDLNYRYPRKSVSMPGQGLRIWTEEDETISLPASPNVIEVSVDKSTANQDLSKDNFVKIIDAINNGKRLPESHIFLRDARDACARGEMRKAAIDAGTAVEITLRNYAIANGIQIRIKPPAMLGWFVHNTAPGLPADTQTKLVDIRNDATHYNTSFNSAAVPDAVKIATQIVEMLEPLVL